MKLYREKESGVSLVIVFFVMIIIVAVVLSTTTLLYNTITLVRNMSYSVISFYAADSGIEKVLYYDRKVLVGADGRGVCQMCDPDGASCPTDDTDGLNCACEDPVVNTPAENPDGCDPDVCSDCTISFTETFGGKEYSIEATVFPDQDPYDMRINSAGYYQTVGRAISVVTGE